MKIITMKTGILAVLALAFSTLNAAPKKPSGKFVINPAQTTLKWVGKKVTGEHTGLVPVASGEITVENGALKSGSFTMDMASLTNTDLTDASMNAKLVGHLKSEDFFSTSKFPTSSFVLTSIVPGSQAGSYIVKGNLTIKGITKPIEFPAAVLLQDKTLKASANITVDRTKYDIRYGSKSFFESIGDKAIYDEFTLNLNLVAVQQ
jgi:polyisoprenoid-binding protein YceI